MGHKMFVTDIVLASCSLVLLSLMSLVTFKVTMLIRLNDKVLLSMLVFLDLTLLGKHEQLMIVNVGKVLFFLTQGINQHVPLTDCTGGIMSALPVFFFSIAVLLNINKWYRSHFLVNPCVIRIYFYFRIEEGISNDQHRFNVKMKILNITTGCLILIILATHCGLLIPTCIEGNP